MLLKTPNYVFCRNNCERNGYIQAYSSWHTYVSFTFPDTRPLDLDAGLRYVVGRGGGGASVDRVQALGLGAAFRAKHSRLGELQASYLGLQALDLVMGVVRHHLLLVQTGPRALYVFWGAETYRRRSNCNGKGGDDIGIAVKMNRTRFKTRRICRLL